VKKFYSGEVAKKGAKMTVILGWSGSEGLSGPGNTGHECDVSLNCKN
jgi:hypothetical protein